ncbi:hypothetical protein [Spirochaeta cellobiosiphila]|uniref:hypothetical protein n=1 Tax=Spirochaeta cellobiosiphila TaxID=504483 RepID=UPI0004048431|nr:hypothetical protein [Spirochaeta cellobiosiphila]
MVKQIFLLVFLGISTTLFAQTVLMDTEEYYKTGGPDASIEYASQFESQIMNALFDNGYIVFNLGSYLKADSLSVQNISTDVQSLASENGAKYLIKMLIQFELDGDNKNIPTQILLSLHDIKSDSVLFDDNLILPTDSSQWDKSLQEDLIAQLVNLL